MRAWKRRIAAATVLVLLLLAAFFLKMFQAERFDSVETLQEYMRTFGVFAPLALTVFQALQVIFPVLPGFLGCAVGAVLFGVAGGFWCNYIGICLGSVIAYFLAEKFGIDIVLLMFSEKKYEKWRARIGESRHYGAFLFAATLLPLFPDDFLCYFSGLIRMDRSKFIRIILLGKPWCILAYSVAFGLIGA